MERTHAHLPVFAQRHVSVAGDLPRHNLSVALRRLYIQLTLRGA